ncbi:unnamed protein product, partial [Ectocarpus fasciculatus]
MGCSHSSKVQGEGPRQDVKKDKDAPSVQNVVVASNDNLEVQSTEGDLHKRMVSSKAVEVMKVRTDNDGSFTVRYAFASQRGYYPD